MTAALLDRTAEAGFVAGHTVTVPPAATPADLAAIVKWYAAVPDGVESDDDRIAILGGAAVDILQDYLARAVFEQTRRFQWNGDLPQDFSLPEPASSVRVYKADGTELTGVRHDGYDIHLAAQVSAGGEPWRAFYVDAVCGWPPASLPDAIKLAIAKVVAAAYKDMTTAGAAEEFGPRVRPLNSALMGLVRAWKVI